ncbi:MAG: sensor histidine kinase [Longimicrobiales bacterium]
MTGNTSMAPEVGHARIRPWLIIGIWAAYAFMSINQSLLWNRVSHREPNYINILGYTGQLCLTWLACTPVAIWATRRFPFGQRGWWRSLLIHVPLMLVMAMLAVRVDRLVGPHFGFERTSAYWSHYLSALDMNLFFYAVIVSLVTAANLHHMFRERQRKAAELHSELVTSKLEMLKVQLQPHFLFNTLNTINALIHEDAEAADRMVTRLADLLRLTLYESRQEVPLARELEFVSAYVDIQQIRFHNRLKVSFDIRGTVLSAQVPSLVLQPLVENAIRHGISPRARAGNVWVRVERNADQLILEVEDDGIGLQPGEDAVVRGIGLANTRARLQQLYGTNQEFVIRSADQGGALVRISIPYVESAEAVVLEAVPQPALVVSK